MSTPILTQLTSSQSSPEVPINEDFQTLEHQAVYGQRQAAHSGLTWGYYGGMWGGFTVANGTLALTNAADNYVVVNLGTGAISVSTTTTNWNDTTNYGKVYKLTAAGSVVTVQEDHRAGPGGVHGGSGAPSGTGAELKGLTFTSDTSSIVNSDPGAGKFRWNNGTQASAGALYFDDLTADGISLATFWASLGATGTILLQQSDDSSKWQLWKWTATPTDGTGYRQFIVSLLAAGGSVANAKTVYALIQSNASTVTVPINAQTGTTYAIAASDRWRRLTFSNAASIAASIAQAGTTGFEDGFGTYVQNIGVGALTITPATSTIDGAASLVLPGGMSAILFSDGANYRSIAIDAAGTPINAQTGTSYTYLSGDRGKLVTHSNGSAIAGTLPQATGAFKNPWFMWVQNRGVGSLTITPTTSTIDGAATLVLTTGQGTMIASDGTNYFTMRGASASGAGLTNWTEALGTAAPNATNPVASFTATGVATHIDVAIVPKGTQGGFALQVADNTTAGGNKRGNRAVDHQMLRTNAANVASGTRSGILDGEDNVTAGTDATAMGVSCSGGGAGSVAGGNIANASATAAIALGDNLVADANYTTAFGSYGSSLAMVGALVHGIRGAALSLGKRQGRHICLVGSTVGATLSTLTSDEAAISATNQPKLATGRGLYIRGHFTIRNTSTGDCGVIPVLGAALKNVGGTVSLSGTPTFGTYVGDAGLNTVTASITADNTNKCATFGHNGIAATNITCMFEGWVADLA